MLGAGEAVAPGQVLRVRQQGPASLTGAPGTDLVHLAAADPVAVGDRLLLLVADHPVPLQTGDLLPGLELVNGYQGTWRLEGDTAVSADPQRTVPLAPLLAPVAQERARGAQPYQPGDECNPLAGVVPPPRPPPPVPCYGAGCGQ